MNYFLCIIVSFFCLILASNAQNSKVELLENQIKNIKVVNVDSAIVLAQLIIAEGKDKSDPKIEINGKLILADLFYYSNEREKGFSFLINAVDLCDSAGMEEEKTDIYYTIGLHYSRNARRPDGSSDVEKLKRALEYHTKGIELARKYNDLVLLSKGYNLSGVCLTRMGLLDEALISYTASEQYSRSANDSIGLGYTLDYAGTLLSEMGKPMEAEKMLLEALEIRKKLLDPFAYAINLNNVGEFYKVQGDLETSIVYLDKSLSISFRNRYQDLAQHTSGLLSEIYLELNQFDKALELKNWEMSLKDSLFNIDRLRIQEEMDTRYETELQARNIIEQDLKISRQNNQLIIILSILIIVLVLAIAIYNRQRQRQKQLQTEIELQEVIARKALIEKMQNERLRLSRDLHDSLGAELTLISSSADNEVYKSTDLVVKSTFEGIGDMSRNAVSILRDTIWAIRKDALDVDEFKLKLIQFIHQRQSIIHIDVENEISDHILLSPSQSLNVFRVCQEVIHNTIKHADASRMLISFKNDSTHVYIQLKDDGTGILSEKSPGYGMSNMKERISEINGEISFSGIPGDGVTVDIAFPRDVK